MTTAITTSSVAFCVPLLIVLGCALLLVLEDRREARLHRRMARDLARPRVGIDAHHFTASATPAEGSGPANPSRADTATERAAKDPDSAAHPLTEKRAAASQERPAA